MIVPSGESDVSAVSGLPVRVYSRRNAALLALLLVGAGWWASMFAWGRIAGAAYDYPWAVGYVEIWRQAFAAHTVPLYRLNSPDVPWVSHGGNRVDEFLFWAHPQATMLPWVVLIPWVPTGYWIVGTICLFYAAGLAGVGALSRRYGLSMSATVMLALLLLANGFLVAKMQVWAMWEGLFLAPWLVWFVFRAAEGERGRLDALGLGIVLAACVYQGQLHMVVMYALALLLFAVTSPWNGWYVCRAGLWGVALGALKLVPLAAMYPFHEAHFDYFPGYMSIESLLDAFAWGTPSRPNWWELDGYVGVAATALGAIGLIIPLVTRDWRRHLQVLVPMVVLAAWATESRPRPWLLDYIWWHNHGWPIVGTERLPSRFMAVAWAFAATSAVVAVDRWRHGWMLLALVAVLTIPAVHGHRSLYATVIPGPARPAVPMLVTDPAPIQHYDANRPNAGPFRQIDYDTHRYRLAIVAGAIVAAGALAAAYRVVRASKLG